MIPGGVRGRVRLAAATLPLIGFAGLAAAAPLPDPAAFAMPGSVLASPMPPVPSAADPLGAPGSYSFAPTAPPSLLAGGVAEQSFGSNGARSTAIGLDSGVSSTGTRLFVSAGTGQTPHWRGIPSATVTTLAGGIQQALPFGTVTVGVTGGRVSVPSRGW